MATPRQHARRRPAFTLLETALAMVIILVGVLAMVEAQRGFHRSNSWSSHEATATYLANEIRELMRRLSRHDPVTGLFLDQDNGGALVGLGPEAGEVEVTDYDDIDDFIDAMFGALGDHPGPIDAFGRVIPQVDENGNVVLDGQGNPLPLQGWTQSVEVEKIAAYNFAQVRDWDAVDAPNGAFPGRAVDEFPLRVTVRIWYQGPYDAEAAEVTSMSWVVPY